MVQVVTGPFFGKDTLVVFARAHLCILYVWWCDKFFMSLVLLPVMAVRVHLWITGCVQGVWFRSRTCNQAVRLGVKGWVKNLPDGRVEMLLEGEKDKVEQMVQWCRRGPPLARVDHINQTVETPTGEFIDFLITG